MSDNTIEHIDVNDEQWDNTPKALRDHVAKLQAALADRDKTIDGYRTAETDRALTDVLAAFKSPSKVRRDLLADKVNPLDSEAVGKWLDENGSDYAPRGENAEPAGTEQQEPQDDGQAAEYGRLTPNVARRPADVDTWERINSEIPDDLPPDQMLARLRASGI